MTDTEGRRIELSIEVPGTVEEVWDAIATGPGITSWFVPMDVEEREGGQAVMDYADFGKITATVEAWEPPHRVVFHGEGEQALAYEWLVEARDAGTCVVRLVTSGFGTGDEWDGEFSGQSEGWKLFFANLRLHLTHFRGQHARSIIPTVMAPGPHDAVWEKLCAGLGTSPSLQAGDRIDTSGAAPKLAGTVVEAVQTPMVSSYLLLLDDPAPGTAFLAVEGTATSADEQVAASAYLYLYGDRAGAVTDDWTPWLRSLF